MRQRNDGLMYLELGKDSSSGPFLGIIETGDLYFPAFVDIHGHRNTVQIGLSLLLRDYQVNRKIVI